MMEKGGIYKLCMVPRHVKSKCQDDQLLGLKIRNDSSPFSDSIIAPFRFGGQPLMRTKEIGKCYHLWITPQLFEKLTHVCSR